jgi:hypothetical protein
MDKKMILLVAFALLSLMSSNANGLDCYECTPDDAACKDKFSTNGALTCMAPTENGLNGKCIVCLLILFSKKILNTHFLFKKIKYTDGSVDRGCGTPAQCAAPIQNAVVSCCAKNLCNDAKVLQQSKMNCFLIMTSLFLALKKFM